MTYYYCHGCVLNNNVRCSTCVRGSSSKILLQTYTLPQNYCTELIFYFFFFCCECVRVCVRVFAKKLSLFCFLSIARITSFIIIIEKLNFATNNIYWPWNCLSQFLKQIKIIHNSICSICVNNSCVCIVVEENGSQRVSQIVMWILFIEVYRKNQHYTYTRHYNDDGKNKYVQLIFELQRQKSHTHTQYVACNIICLQKVNLFIKH